MGLVSPDIAGIPTFSRSLHGQFLAALAMATKGYRYFPNIAGCLIKTGEVSFDEPGVNGFGDVRPNSRWNQRHHWGTGHPVGRMVWSKATSLVGIWTRSPDGTCQN